LILILAVFLGWRYWNRQTEQQQAQASIVYEQMVNELMAQNGEKVYTKAEQLINHHPKTPYASWASLLLAHLAVQNQAYDRAQKRLDWVLSHGHIASIRQIARDRKARIYIQLQQPKKALETLSQWDDKSYQAVVAEIRGDAYKALGKKNQAQQAYQQAIKALPKNAPNGPLVKMKAINVAK
jgi:predicted negative regulator of RcsB-dependent stress response